MNLWIRKIVLVLWEHPRLGLGVALASIVLLFAYVLPLYYTTDPFVQNLPSRLSPPVWLKGVIEHPLGTDQLGRDILSRLMMGTRISLQIGIGAVAVSAIFGTAMGMISGYLGGWVDTIIQRWVELQMAFPFIVIALILMAFIRGTPWTIVLVFSFTGWPIYGRMIRGVTLAVRQKEFVEVAKSIGGLNTHILYHHILPNIINTAIVLATLELSVLIYAEAALSFLGIGIQPPTPSLGVMLGEGRVYLSNAWWLATLPGLVLMIITLAVNFLGDGLREALDPTLTESPNQLRPGLV